FKNNQDAVICGTQHQVVDERVSMKKDEPVSVFKIKDLLWRNRFSTPSVMLKREISLRFDNKLRFAEDYLLWMEIAATHGSVNRINQPLTILHKPEFGSAGLSSKTWSMYRGEIKALSLLNQKKHINTLTLFRSVCWSTIKLIKRLPRTIIRKNQ
ncbi:MAG: hypothetical protein RI890_1048, partial [Actinomycetota bacterium]